MNGILFGQAVMSPLNGIIGIIFLILIVAFLVKLWSFLYEVPTLLRSLPDRIADRMIEKLREEEKRKQESEPRP